MRGQVSFQTILVSSLLASSLVSIKSLTQDLPCGTISKSLMKPSVRIVGGSDAKPGQYPHQVRLERHWSSEPTDVYSFCGATILDANHILTAAHCVTSFPDKKFSAVVGAHLKVSDDVRYYISDLEIHEGFDGTYGKDDIALLKTATPITFGLTPSGESSVNRVCLPSRSVDYKFDERFIITGWGYINSLGTRPSIILQQANLTYIPGWLCNLVHKLISSQLLDPKIIICAAGDPGVGPCKGDSGGPLVRIVDGAYELVGITSFGDVNNWACSKESLPEMFTRIDGYLDWIEWAKQELNSSSRAV